MTEKQRYPLAQAEAVAKELVVLLAPACEREPVVAGSVRRRSPTAGDVELVAIPKPSADAFYLDELDRVVYGLLTDGRLTSRGAYGPKNKFLVHVASGIPVDIFTASVENFGRDLMIRTGPKDWNKKVMRRFLELGGHGHAYGPWAVSWDYGAWEAAPDEATMFGLLRWPYVQPGART